MGLFGCKACEAKDDEIRWLRHELELRRRIETETVKPGLAQMIEPGAVKLTERPTPLAPKKRQPTFPGYEPSPEAPEVEVS